MVVPPTPSDIANRMNNPNLQNQTQNRDPRDWRAAGAYDPSVGPTPSTMTTAWRQTAAPSR
jgi:hypothetical protein